ncbi:hypothetical protein DPMN_120607 [Dreissena polymorpha]|uniref:Uncharacterized protein n=1 Tax=Dreissena polymorpha TaxID=45954 RepID=A0A9D4GPA1_DREPO|nr:hypothetical protein DPMN_120607 [Dreissena polymorpha]
MPSSLLQLYPAIKGLLVSPAVPSSNRSNHSYAPQWTEAAAERTAAKSNPWAWLCLHQIHLAGVLPAAR